MAGKTKLQPGSASPEDTGTPDRAGSQDNADNEVGYGRPPQHSRWQKGQSGNPRGRKKGSRGLKSDLHAELVSKMTIQINGRPVSGTKQQLMLKTLTARAAAGDVRAIEKLVQLVLQIFGPEDRGTGAGRLSAQDQALLDELLGERGIGGDPADDPAGDLPCDPGDDQTPEKDDED